MNQLVSRRIVAPGDCVLSFGIPTSEEEFYEAKHNPGNRDFVVNNYWAWQKYYIDIVRHLESAEPAIRSTGARIVRSLTLAQFARLLSEERVTVLILFSHWKDDSVEFADGVFKVSDVIDCIPDDYSGIIDLGICHPISLAREVQTRKPGCLVRYTDTVATPYYWLHFYVVVFKLLNESRLTYLKAVEAAVDAFLTKGRWR
jgi:hypothetical protein